LLGLLAFTTAPALAAGPPTTISATPSSTEPYYACPTAKAGGYKCEAIVEPSAYDRQLSVSGEAYPSRALGGGGLEPSLEPAEEEKYGELEGLSPQNLWSAYKLTGKGGSGETVAIVDAYNDPNAESDLKKYRDHYGLSECTRANGCFQKLNQKGESSTNETSSIYPVASATWSVEMSLDLDVVSAICQECHIVLVEANKEGNELDTAETEAASLNPEGSETKYYFEYGTSVSYGTKTAEASAGSGTSGVKETKAITGLAGGTKYDFRIVATNGDGTTYGANEAFTTAKPEFKPAPTKRKFTMSGGASKWDDGTISISCSKTSATGEIDGTQTVGNVVVLYSGCKRKHGEGSACPVKSVGAKAEEIVTEPLDGELGTVATSQTASGVGLRFRESPGEEAIWFVLQGNNCTSEDVFSGALAAEVSVISKKQATNQLVFNVSGTSEKIKEITLDSGVTEKLGLKAAGQDWTIETTDQLTLEEPLEVT
jgi:hypothetical protein